MGIGDADCAAGFATAGDREAIAAHRQIRSSGGAGDVRRIEGDGRRLRTGAVDCHDTEGFTVGLRANQRQQESTVSGHRRAPEQFAVGGTDFDRGAGPGGAGQLAAVAAQTEIAWRRRFDDLRRADRCAGRDIACGIGGIHCQRLTAGLRGAEDDAEGAIGRNHGAAEQAAIGGAHLDGRADFTGAAELRAVGAHSEVARRSGRGGIRRSDRTRRRNVARRVGERDVERLAIVLWRTQVDLETAIGANGTGTQKVAGCIAYLNDTASFAKTTQHPAIGRQG